MKDCSAALNDLIMQYVRGEKTTWYIAELYTFWLRYDIAYNAGYFNSGVILLYTGHDVDLTVGGNKYTHWAIEHGDINEKRGTEVADMDLTINYTPTDLIKELNVPWIEAFQSGAFDGAYLSLDRLYSPIPWRYNMPNISSDYVLKSRFFGRIDVQEAKLTTCTLNVKSPVDLLNAQLPRNLIKPSCLNKFCDSMCSLNKDNYKVDVTAQNGSSKTGIKVSGYADGYFTQGTMLCTEGANIGVTRSIKTYISGVATPAEPFKLPVSAGDKFSFWRGCAKTMVACKAFNNMQHFRGFPFLPCQNVLL